MRGKGDGYKPVNDLVHDLEVIQHKKVFDRENVQPSQLREIIRLRVAGIVRNTTDPLDSRFLGNMIGLGDRAISAIIALLIALL